MLGVPGALGHLSLLTKLLVIELPIGPLFLQFLHVSFIGEKMRVLAGVFISVDGIKNGKGFGPFGDVVDLFFLVSVGKTNLRSTGRLDQLHCIFLIIIVGQEFGEFDVFVIPNVGFELRRHMRVEKGASSDDGSLGLSHHDRDRVLV